MEDYEILHNFVVLDLFVFPSIAPWFVLCSHYRLSYGGPRLWGEYQSVLSADKREVRSMLCEEYHSVLSAVKRRYAFL